jgi:serine/threonine protein kinase
MAELPSLIGQTVSHYRILLKLGEGGMGVVYRAVDERLKRDVALKFLPDTLAKDEHALSRLQREAEAASRLSHPNICTIYEISEDGGRVFIVMELIFGRTLKDHISGALLSITETIDIAIQIADALDTAHENGVIHRDVKPENVIITTRGLAKVLDFGLAKIQPQNNLTLLASLEGLGASNSESLTRLGDLVGTVAYMSPEQARVEELDARTDLFSFGILLYEISAGSRPFCGNGSVAMLHAIMENVPIPPTRLNPDVPAELERIITKALEKDRNLRYQRASEIRSDLERLRRDIDSKRTENTSDDKEPVAQSRVLEAAAPKQSLVGRATEIVTVIRLPDSEGLRKYIIEEKLESFASDDVRKKPFFLEFSPDSKGKLQSAEVILKIDSPNFKPRSQSKKLKVPPKHDSEVCTFLLTPLLCGELVVNLELLVGDQVVVSKSVRTRAELEGTQVSPARVIVTVPLLLAVLDGRLLGNLRAMPPLLAQQTQRKEQLRESQNRVTDDVAVAAAMNAELERTGASWALSGKKPEGTEPFPQTSANDLPAKPIRLSKPKIMTRAAGLLAVLFVVLGVALLWPSRNPKQVARPPLAHVARPPEAQVAPHAEAQATSPPVASAPPQSNPHSKPRHDNSNPADDLFRNAVPSPDGELRALQSTDELEIKLLIQQLSYAFSNRSIAKLREIWPQMGDNEKALKGSFDSAQSFSREFHIVNISIHPDGKTADVEGTYEGKSISERKELTSSGKFALKLSKRDGNWYIDRAIF